VYEQLAALQDRICDDKVYNDLVRHMVYARPKHFIMTDDALLEMNNLREHLFFLEQASGGLAPGFQSFVGKLHGLCGSLTLILHLATHIQDIKDVKDIDTQTVEHTDQLVRNFVIPHALEFYCGSERGNSDRIRRVASWILTSAKQRIVASDLTTNVADCRGMTLMEVNAHISPLVAGGWLLPEVKTPVCRAWAVNPQVHTRMAARAVSEEQRKGAIVKAMGGRRRAVRPG
jgi:hypothetical protein